MPGPGPGHIPGSQFVQGDDHHPDGAPAAVLAPPGHRSPRTAFRGRPEPHTLGWTIGSGTTALLGGTASGESGVADTAALTVRGELAYSNITVHFDDEHILNEVRITRAGGTTQVAEDASSQSKYLKRSLEMSDVHTETDSHSLYAAQWILSLHKDPQLRVDTLTVQPQRDPVNLWPLILDIDLLDRITVKRRPQDIGEPIETDVIVQGIAHDVTPETWTVTLQLAPAAPHTYWVWDSSSWDGGDYWAPY